MYPPIKNLYLAVLLIITLSACSLLPAVQPDAASTIQAVFTSQSATIVALQTLAASHVTNTPSVEFEFPTLVSITPLPSIPSLTAASQNLEPSLAPSLTPNPSLTTIPSLTPMASLTRMLSLTPIPAKTSAPTATATPQFCNAVAFVKDVTYPDNAYIAPGAVFTKTWRLKNIGTCTWKTTYKLVFTSGDNMNAAADVKIPSAVLPGKMVDLSVELVAPPDNGAHSGYWKLENASGDMFGVGPTASEAFWVKINVMGVSDVVFDFMSDYCLSEWQSGAGPLTCPGTVDDPSGFVKQVNDPKLESGESYYGQSLFVAPQTKTNGYIQGIYPAYSVHKGDHFRAVINCAYESSGCNAIFRLDYKIGSGSIKTFWKFTEVYDGQYYSADVNLSSLSGKSVKFILTVLSNGSADNDKLYWVQPRIEHH